MMLRMKWPLQAPEDNSGSTGAPSGNSLPATTSGTAPELPDISADNARLGTENADDNAGGDQPVDWSAIDAEGTDEAGQQTGDAEGDRGEPSKPAAQPQKPAAQPSQAQAKPQAQPDDQQQPAALTEEEVQRRVQEELAKQGQQPPGETPEQKTAREAQERQAHEQAQAKFRQQLEEYYKIPEDLAAKLQSEPELVLPTMAARVHEAVINATRQMFYAEAPQMFAQMQARAEANVKAKTAFYSAWPQLKPELHEKHVLQVARMFRQMNPKATPEQVIDRVGRVVTAALNLSQEPKQNGSGGTPQGQRPAQRSTFRPAATAANNAPAAPPADNVFTQLAEEFLQDDQG